MIVNLAACIVVIVKLRDDEKKKERVFSSNNNKTITWYKGQRGGLSSLEKPLKFSD